MTALYSWAQATADLAAQAAAHAAQVSAAQLIAAADTAAAKTTATAEAATKQVRFAMALAVHRKAHLRLLCPPKD